MSYFNGQDENQSNKETELPEIVAGALTDPQGYRAPNGLVDAVNVALTLGMPLLLTGEPGSGKSRLAHRIAWEFQLQAPLEFTVKSDTKGRDLFYSYDTLGRFHAVNLESKASESKVFGVKKSSPQDFIYFNALGKAILLAKESNFAYQTLKLSKQRFKHSDTPQRSVVLIDEIDKAPRDVPNDLLTEIDNLAFRIPELETILGREFLVELDQKSDKDPQGESRTVRLRTPIVIITSNSEKALPEAFLRRCVYYHVPFPEFESSDPEQVTVQRIVESRLGARYKTLKREVLVTQALKLFQQLREERDDAGRKPSIAEFLNWLDYLLQLKIDRLDENSSNVIGSIKTVLLKLKKDQNTHLDFEALLKNSCAV